MFDGNDSYELDENTINLILALPIFLLIIELCMHWSAYLSLFHFINYIVLLELL